MNNTNISVGDVVVELGADSVRWTVTKVLVPRWAGMATLGLAKLSHRDRSDTVTFVPVERLTKVG